MFRSLLFALALPLAAQNALVVVSIDGMRPDYVLKADEHGLKIPHLRRILKDGAHATGVRGVLPTVTYPSHTTILTGVWPAKHRIYSNVVFDPFDLNLAGWMWYAEDIAVPTLWDAAAKAGFVTGSVSWPVSVGAKSVRYNIPEYWRASKFPGEDIKLMRVVSTPGLMAEIEKEAGAYVTDLDDAEHGDRQRTRYAAYILRNKRAQFVTVHLASLDHLEHAGGPFSAPANAALEQIDAEVGELEDAARSVSPNPVICVLSDHGFTRTDHSFNIVAPMMEAGLITKTNGKVTAWKAYPDLEAGSAAIILKDPNDEATRTKVGQLLKRLAEDPNNGIAQILEPLQIAVFGGRPEAAYWVDMQSNFSVVNTDRPARVGGTHGYAPSNPQLLASFFIAGPKIKSGVNLGEIDMRSIAATLAQVLGVPFPSADLAALPVF
ncbi:MAG TPA: ectonucleotide pyrophosphatase/phosphodiesterase [Bryobacteraceae bacterium]|nr:ectonucleotide pyrophosphatase/phosphodiesterase [Bryobacteraceae bacterium]